MKDIESKYINRIYQIEKYMGLYRQKCRRNLRMYEYSPTIDITTFDGSQVVGYYSRGTFDIEDDTTSSIQENVIKSCIDTLVSKIAARKVRPFFNGISSDFEQRQTIIAAQDFFDQFYDDQNVNRTITEGFRDACIFDRGVIYINKAEKKIEKLMPYQVYFDPKQVAYNKLSEIVIKKEHYPAAILGIEDKDDVTLYEYFSTISHKHVTYIMEEDKVITETWEGPLPFVFIHYSNPIKGNSSQSIVDMLYGIQMEIDDLMTKIKDASQLASPLTYFIPEESTIKANKLDADRVGQVITYSTTPGMTGSPVTVATTPFMDPQWMQTIETLKQHAFDMVGITQLSATGQKPMGLNSGVALSTAEDIESDRFQTQLNQVIRAYVEIARLCIEIFPQDEDILPPNRQRPNISWKDIVEAKNSMVVQFSAQESLSKDPSTKLQQINYMVQMGWIPRSRAPELMQMPDLNLGYNIASNAINAVQAVIQDCVEHDNYSIPDYIPNELLKQEISNAALSLRAAGNKNDGDIAKLVKLFAIAGKRDVDAMTSAEMAATSSLQQEIAQAMAPGGQISNMMQQAQQNFNMQNQIQMLQQQAQQNTANQQIQQ